MKKKLGIIGCCGRMGISVARLAMEGDFFDLGAVIEGLNHPSLGKSYRQITNLGKTDLKITAGVETLTDKPDVLIDFSHHDATLVHLKNAAEKKIAYVIGTTGFTEKELSSIAGYAKKIPIVLSPNMSLGMNVVFLAAELLAKKLGNPQDLDSLAENFRLKSPPWVTLVEFPYRTPGKVIIRSCNHCWEADAIKKIANKDLQQFLGKYWCVHDKAWVEGFNPKVKYEHVKRIMCKIPLFTQLFTTMLNVSYNFENSEIAIYLIY